MGGQKTQKTSDIIYVRSLTVNRRAKDKKWVSAYVYFQTLMVCLKLSAATAWIDFLTEFKIRA